MKHKPVFQFKKFSELSKLDLYDIFKLRVDVFVVEQECPYPEIDRTDKKAIHATVRLGGDLASYLRIYTANDGFVHMGRIVTKKEFRGNKLGRDLIDRSIKLIQEKYPDKSIRIGAQEHLENYYEKFGFKRISEMYLEDGIPHIDMVLEIT